MCICALRADDLKVSMAGPLTHLPQIAVWACLLAMGNSGDVALRSFWVLYVTDNFWVDMCRGAIGVRPRTA